MSKLNTPTSPISTHEGSSITLSYSPSEQKLNRAVLACLLWEDSFYEEGFAIADRIALLVPECHPEFVADLAIRARTDGNLRHAPLLLACLMASNFSGKIVGDTIYKVIQRADELTEILAIYWRNGKCPLSSQMKLGLARAWRKFDEYSLAKCDREGEIRLRDSLRLCHAKPKDDKQDQLWKRLLAGTLATPDTWEVRLSGGEDKREAFTQILTDNKIGYLALLRNLRGMCDAGVSEKLVSDALRTGKKDQVSPFRFISAAQAAPQYVSQLCQAMLASLASQKAARGLPGKTVLLVDHSGSMDASLSDRSPLSRLDAAGVLAILLKGVCERIEVVCFSTNTVRIPLRDGLALWAAIRDCMRTGSTPTFYLNKPITVQSRMDGGGTQLDRAVAAVSTRNGSYPFDRLIVITDEQSSGRVAAPDEGVNGYMINVGSSTNRVGYGAWHHIDGFSESIVPYIQAVEWIDL